MFKPHINCTILMQDEPQKLKIRSDLDLLSALRKKNVPIPFSCGGEGICTTCRVFLIEGELSKANDLELEQVKKRGFKPNERLSCQCHPVSDKITLKLP